MSERDVTNRKCFGSSASTTLLESNSVSSTHGQDHVGRCLWSQHLPDSQHLCAQKKRDSAKFELSLGRVDPAPHTQHLLGPFEAIAQNSLLRSFSIVDSLANRQHSCRGSEELAIRFQATPNYTPSYSKWGATKNSELLRATPSSSKPLRATPSGY